LYTYKMHIFNRVRSKVEILESQIVLFSLASWKQNNLHSLAKIGQGYICTPEVNELRLKSILVIIYSSISFIPVQNYPIITLILLGTVFWLVFFRVRIQTSYSKVVTQNTKNISDVHLLVIHNHLTSFCDHKETSGLCK
jgi:hypothetical protein